MIPIHEFRDIVYHFIGISQSFFSIYSHPKLNSYRDSSGHKPHSDPFGGNGFGMNQPRNNGGLDDIMSFDSNVAQSVYVNQGAQQSQSP